MMEEKLCSTCGGKLNEDNKCAKCLKDPDYCDCYDKKDWEDSGIITDVGTRGI